MGEDLMAGNGIDIKVARLEEQTKSQQKEIDNNAKDTENVHKRITIELKRVYDKWASELAALNEKIDKLNEKIGKLNERIDNIDKNKEKKSIFGSIFKLGG